MGFIAASELPQRSRVRSVREAVAPHAEPGAAPARSGGMSPAPR